MARWMIYGANGYTGELIAREAVRRGERPLLAGRDAAAVGALARELECEARAFDLASPDLSGVDAVLHCAGPFIHTSRPMVDACLAAGVHYLDITGEVGVFEAIFAREAEAQRAGVVLLPGVGFDVVPTDCLAAMLHQRLPDAVDLSLAFFNRRGGISRGTMKTTIEGAGEGSAIRRDGKLVKVPLLFDVREIPFAGRPRLAMAIPWGDLATAWRTTGIPNIRVYLAVPAGQVARMRRLAPLLPLARLTLVRKLLSAWASRRRGPSAEQRAAARVELWGRVANQQGDEVSMTMETPDGYTFTVLSALAAVQRLLAETPRAGAHTPARYFGPRFVTTLEGVSEPVVCGRDQS